MSLASGSIDLKSLKVAGEPNKYITYISPSDGIKIFDGTNSTNYIKINANGTTIYKNNNMVTSITEEKLAFYLPRTGYGDASGVYEAASFNSEGLTLSAHVYNGPAKADLPYFKLKSNGLYFYQLPSNPLATQQIRASIIENAITFRDVNNSSIGQYLFIGDLVEKQSNGNYYATIEEYCTLPSSTSSAGYNWNIQYKVLNLIGIYAYDGTNWQAINNSYFSFNANAGDGFKDENLLIDAINFTQTCVQQYSAQVLKIIYTTTSKYTKYFSLGTRSLNTPAEHSAGLTDEIKHHIGAFSTTIGFDNIAEGIFSFASGYQVSALGHLTAAIGDTIEVRGLHSYGIGDDIAIKGDYNIAQGSSFNIVGNYNYAEGYSNSIKGSYNHIEGVNNNYAGTYSSIASSGSYNHQEGRYTTIYTTEDGVGSYIHLQNLGTIGCASAQTAIGRYNQLLDLYDQSKPYGDYALYIGNGTSSSARSNALTVDWNGNVNIASGAKYKINGTALSAADVNALATSAAYTRSSAGGLDWSNNTEGNSKVIMKSALAFWNGSYDGSTSNLTRFKASNGTSYSFGTLASKNSLSAADVGAVPKSVCCFANSVVRTPSSGTITFTLSELGITNGQKPVGILMTYQDGGATPTILRYDYDASSANGVIVKVYDANGNAVSSAVRFFMMVFQGSWTSA